MNKKKYSFQKLATLHARSLDLKFRDTESFKKLLLPLKEAIFPVDDKPCMGLSLETSIKMAVKQLQSLGETDDIIKGINFIKSFETKTFNIMSNIVKPGQNKYDVITHGDSWINNFLFKHDENGCVADVKLIDFQIVRHVSPSIDFHYFVYSSANNYVINNHYDDLVNIYYNKLNQQLRLLNVNDQHLSNLTIDWFKNELKNNSLYGFFTSFWLVNAILAEDEDVINLDEITQEQMEKLGDWETPVKPLKAERIKNVVRHYMKQYG